MSKYDNAQINKTYEIEGISCFKSYAKFFNLSHLHDRCLDEVLLEEGRGGHVEGEAVRQVPQDRLHAVPE